MHLDDIVPNVANEGQGNALPVGCSTIMCNQPGQVIQTTSQTQKNNCLCSGSDFNSHF